MSFILAQSISNLEMKVAAKASSLLRRGLFVQDAGPLEDRDKAITTHACRDALTSAYELFMQSYMRPLYTEILFSFPDGVPSTITLPLLTIRFLDKTWIGDYIHVVGGIAMDRTFLGFAVGSPGDKIGVVCEALGATNVDSVKTFDPVAYQFRNRICSAVSTIDQIVAAQTSTVDPFCYALPPFGGGNSNFNVLHSPQDVSKIDGVVLEQTGRHVRIDLPPSGPKTFCLSGYAVPQVCFPLCDIRIAPTDLIATTYNSVINPLASFTQFSLLCYYEEVISTAMVLYLMGADDARYPSEAARLQAMLAALRQQPPNPSVVYTNKRGT